jgi:hypothetical protein
MGRIQQQLFEHRREILCAIRAFAYADSYANAMHGEMHTDAEASPDSTSPALITQMIPKFRRTIGSLF